MANHLSGRDGHEVSEVSEVPAGGQEYYANLSERPASGILDGTYRAILCCGIGIGVCMSANKVPGIRAVQTHDTYSAAKAATSNNAQIITIGSRVVGAELAMDIADAFLAAAFDPEGRSADNVGAIDALDAKYNAR